MAVDMFPKKNTLFRLLSTGLAFILFLNAREGSAEEILFNPNALEIENPSETSVDLSQFSSSGAQAPGVYRVDVYVNGERKETEDISFILGEDKNLVPQLNSKELHEWGVDMSTFLPNTDAVQGKVISDLSKLIPHSNATFDFSHQRLDISIPQAAMRQSAQGYVDPKYWDEGINALLMDYSFTGSDGWQHNGGQNKSYFMNLHSGINWGAWRLRNYSTWNYNKVEGDQNNTQDSTKRQWDSISTFLQRDLPKIKGQMIIGENSTNSDVFESVMFRGAQILSDDNMLPDSLRGFAPTVRGIANSNAKVTIKQNGSTIYQTYVSPGLFAINDLYPTSSSGDLQVTITEADGSEHTFIQPFSNVPVMQREGHLKYSVTAGKYHSYNNNDNAPILGQATLIYGLPHDLTVYGGLQSAGGYHAYALGLGMSLGEIGSVSLDGTQAYTPAESTDPIHENRGNSSQGQSYRFQYSKDITETDSTITLAGYRYSTKGFYTLQEAMDNREYDSDTLHNNKRSKIQVELSQSLMQGQWGSLSLSGYQQDYWNESGYERNFSVSYSNTVWKGISWNIMYTYTQLTNSAEDNNKQLALNFSIPLSQWLPNSYVSTGMTSDMRGKEHYQTTLSGTALQDNNLTYSIAQGYGNKNEGNSGAVNADYKGSYGEVNAGYNYNDDIRQVTYGAQGSVIVHENGVTLGQSLAGDMTSLALIEAPGASGAKVQYGSGIRTDWRGYTVVPYLSPYKRTRIGLDPATFSESIDMKENVTTVVPTAGAVVLAGFKTRVGQRVLMTLKKGNQNVPFGALVSVDGSDDETTSIVGDGGQVYLSGIPEVGDLTVKWGNEGSGQCHVHFLLPENKPNMSGNASSVLFYTANCI